MEESVLCLRGELVVDRGKLHDFHEVERPAVRAGDFLHLLARLRKADVENLLARVRAG
jgi:hypothetical protein